MSRRRLALAALAAAVLIGLAAAGVVTSPGARADAAPAVTIEVPASAGGCLPECLRGSAVLLKSVAKPFAGRPIASVQFQRSPAGAGSWTTIGTDVSEPYAVVFNARTVPDGLYDFRAVATDSGQATSASAPAADRVVANFYRPALLADPGSPLDGKVTLTATTQVDDPAVSVEFQRAPAGTDTWTTIAADASAEGSPPSYSVEFDTTGAPDGAYDLRAVPHGAPAGVPRRRRLVDNTPPTLTLSRPAAPLSGVVTLNASADDAGAGVASVRFERAPAGSGTWTAIGTRRRAPFAQPFDTRGLAAGGYDLRAIATDRAGNAATSDTVGGVAVSNPSGGPAPRLAIENFAAPADDVKLLGAVAGSPQHEAWGYGTSSAPPASVDGVRLPYTAPGRQLVLLRYTDAGGWQIADVLRNADGSAFELAQPGDRGTPTLTGRMTASGEAWVALTRIAQGGTPVVSLFHRTPGSRFAYDAAATQAVHGVTSGGIASLRVAQSGDGRPYGVLVGKDLPSRYVDAPQPGGAPSVLVDARLDLGVLDGGAWTTKRAPLPEGQAFRDYDVISIRAADLSAPGTGWAAMAIDRQDAGPRPLLLARFDGDRWSSVTTGLDALDLTDRFAGADLAVSPTGVRADGDAVWVDAGVGSGSVLVRYDRSLGEVTDSWCRDLPQRTLDCAAPMGSARLPDAIFDTPSGPVAVALPPANAFGRGTVHVFAHGTWSRIAVPGYGTDGESGRALFTGPREGWLSGPNALGRIGAGHPAGTLALWPQANRAPLTGVAVPPGSDAAVAASGALAVGMGGTTLRYDARAGWQVEPVPERARRLNLRAVAFAGPSRAFAVGQAGTILRWEGDHWSDDPQSGQITQTELTALAFAPSGEGWAVGRYGTILHFDGTSWTEERPPAEDEGLHLTSVTVAGPDVFAVIGGNLIERDRDGTWGRVDASALPDDPAPRPGELRLVSGLPDGGLVAAGRSVALVRQAAGERFAYSAQPLEGIAVALTAFRPDGADVRAFVSVAPPAASLADVAGYPPGDGELLRQTGAGWEDLSRSQYAGRASGVPTDGVVKVDPVLAIAPSPSGEHAWVVGGFAGTLTAAGFGTDLPLPARASNWQTSSVWRYDAGGSDESPAQRPATVSLPARPDTVSFAFFSSAVCQSECAGTIDAQPDVNLRATATQVAAFAREPGGPAFAMLGGNARNRNATDFAELPDLLAPLGEVPLYAAYGPRDAVPGLDNPAQPWADAFARAPAPFGPASPPDPIAPVGAGAPTGAVHRYYAFDARQNGGRLRAVVLDNSAGSLEASAPGQTAWLTGVLTAAQADGVPVVVVAPRALRPGGASDGSQVAALLAGTGVLAAFTTYPAEFPAAQLNERRTVPVDAPEGAPTLPEYEGATLGYQETANNGVLWYFVAVDTAQRKVDVQAIPVVASLALKPLLGLSVARSSTLAFEAVGRRPVGTLPVTPGATTSGIDNYVGIPAPGCGSRPCMTPSYRFASSDPTIGDFVRPSGPGSRYPLLDSKGQPVGSATSGLFCGFNSGTTVVSVTVGLLTSSLPVTVQPGGIGRPCGTVFRAGVRPVVLVPPRTTIRTTPPPAASSPPPAPPPSAAPIAANLPQIALPPPPAPAARPPAPPPFVPALPPPASAPPPIQAPGAPVVAVPPIPPAMQPIPPGGAASAQAAARRKEKAKQHAESSAYVTRPAGVSGADWFYPALGGASILAMLLVAGGMRPRGRPRAIPAYGEARWR